MNGYQLKSIKTLFDNYVFEHDRIDNGDAMLTRRLIRDELRRRTEAAIKRLEQATTEAEAAQIYKQFIEH